MFGTTWQNCLERHLSPVLLKSKIKKCYECFVPNFSKTFSFPFLPASILLQGECAILLTQNSSYFYSLCTILNHQVGSKAVEQIFGFLMTALLLKCSETKGNFFKRLCNCLLWVQEDVWVWSWSFSAFFDGWLKIKMFMSLWTWEQHKSFEQMKDCTMGNRKELVNHLILQSIFLVEITKGLERTSGFLILTRG